MSMRFSQPTTRSHLFDLMTEGRYELIAGGTDQYVRLEKEDFEPDHLISLSRIPGLAEIKGNETEVQIGAGATHRQLVESAAISNFFPTLSQAARTVGSVQLRNQGTIGGNVCNASPSGDTILPLYLHEARVHIRSRGGSRTERIEEFIQGPGDIKLKRGEFVEKFSLPKPGTNYRTLFKKVGRRNAMEIAVCTMGFLLRLDKGVVSDLRLAYGAVAPTVIRLRSIEQFLKDGELTVDRLQQAESLLQKAISPIGDVRASARYRQEVSRRLLYELTEV